MRLQLSGSVKRVQSWSSRQDVDGTVQSFAVLRLRVSDFVTKFELGRQAAWRPRGNRGNHQLVLVAKVGNSYLCGKQIAIAVLRLSVLGLRNGVRARSSSCLAAEGQSW